jgi:hypothetical protein
MAFSSKVGQCGSLPLTVGVPPLMASVSVLMFFLLGCVGLLKSVGANLSLARSFSETTGF